MEQGSEDLGLQKKSAAKPGFAQREFARKRLAELKVKLLAAKERGAFPKLSGKPPPKPRGSVAKASNDVPSLGMVARLKAVAPRNEGESRTAWNKRAMTALIAVKKAAAKPKARPAPTGPPPVPPPPLSAAAPAPAADQGSASKKAEKGGNAKWTWAAGKKDWQGWKKKGWSPQTNSSSSSSGWKQTAPATAQAAPKVKAKPKAPKQ
jgi:hypothetical protein